MYNNWNGKCLSHISHVIKTFISFGGQRGLPSCEGTERGCARKLELEGDKAFPACTGARCRKAHGTVDCEVGVDLSDSAVGVREEVRETACKCGQTCKTHRDGAALWRSLPLSLSLCFLVRREPLSSTFNICHGLKCLVKHLCNVSAGSGKSFVESEEIICTLSKYAVCFGVESACSWVVGLFCFF